MKKLHFKIIKKTTGAGDKFYLKMRWFGLYFYVRGHRYWYDILVGLPIISKEREEYIIKVMDDVIDQKKGERERRVTSKEVKKTTVEIP